MNNYSVPLEHGFLFNPTVANPASGADWFYLTPNNRRYELVGVRFVMTTDANVANRNINLQISVGVDIKVAIPMSVVQPASTSFKYQYLQGVHAPTLLPSNNELMALPPRLFIPANYLISTTTVNIQVADQFTDIELLFNTWIERSV